MTFLRPTILIRCRSSSVDSTPDVLTLRISPISAARHRLLVGDHRQRFERGHRELVARTARGTGAAPSRAYSGRVVIWNPPATSARCSPPRSRSRPSPPRAPPARLPSARRSAACSSMRGVSGSGDANTSASITAFSCDSSIRGFSSSTAGTDDTPWLLAFGLPPLRFPRGFRRRRPPSGRPRCRSRPPHRRSRRRPRRCRQRLRPYRSAARHRCLVVRVRSFRCPSSVGGSTWAAAR